MSFPLSVERGLRKCFLISFAMLLTVHSLARAEQSDPKNTRVAGSFLRLNPGVRTAALGGSQTALSSGFEALFSNPASLATLPMPELWLAHRESFIDTRYETFGFGLPFHRQGMGLVVQYVDEGRNERIGIDADNNPVKGLGSFRPYEASVQLGWALRLGPRLSIGILGKQWTEKLDNTSISSWAGDIGLQSSIGSFLDIGVSGKNLGPKKNGYELPRSVAFGFGIKLKPVLLNRLSILSELDHSSYKGSVWRTGVEMSKGPIALRAGYDNGASRNLKGLSHFGFGLGVQLRSLSVNYTWKDSDNLGSTHLVSLSVGFGLTPEEKERMARQLDRAMLQRMVDRSKKHFMEGEKALREENWEKATLEFSQSLSWDPQNQKARQYLNQTKVLQQKEEAEHLFEQGVQFVNQRRWIDATLYFQETLKLNPHHEKAADQLVKTRRKISDSQSFSKGSNNETEIAYNRGVLHYINGQFDSALRYWEFVMVRAPMWPNIQEYVAKAKSKKLEQELKSKEEASLSKEIENLSHKAYTLFTLGNTDEAIATWKRIVALDPSNQDAAEAIREAESKKELAGGISSGSRKSRVEELNTKALNHYVEGKLIEAVRIWRQALEYDPNNLKIKNNLRRVESEIALNGNYKWRMRY